MTTFDWVNYPKGLLFDERHAQINRNELKNGNIKFIAVKMGYGLYKDQVNPYIHDQVQAAADINVPCILVYEFDNEVDQEPDHPQGDAKRDYQVLELLRLANGKVQDGKARMYHAIAIRIFKWWIFETEWQEYLNGTRKIDEVKELTNTRISREGQRMLNRVQDLCNDVWFRKVPVFLYSSNAKLVERVNQAGEYTSPDMKVWGHLFPQWVDISSGLASKREVTWAELWKADTQGGYLPPRETNIIVPIGNGTRKIVDVYGKNQLVLPGIRGVGGEKVGCKPLFWIGNMSTLATAMNYDFSAGGDTGGGDTGGGDTGGGDTGGDDPITDPTIREEAINAWVAFYKSIKDK